MGEGIHMVRIIWIFVYISFFLMVTVLVFYCCIARYYKFCGLKQCKIIISQFYRYNSGATWLVLCVESHRTKIRMLARAENSIGDSGPPSKLPGYWQILAPWSWGTELPSLVFGGVFLLAVCQELLSAAGGSSSSPAILAVSKTRQCASSRAAGKSVSWVSNSRSYIT